MRMCVSLREATMAPRRVTQSTAIRTAESPQMSPDSKKLRAMT